MSEKVRDAKTKIAVVLFNFGGPDCMEAVKPFLFNFFMDPNVIRLPLPLRYMLAWIISYRRSKYEAGIFRESPEDESPILDNTHKRGFWKKC